MLTYDLEKRGSVPIYEYLYGVLKKDIVSGKLRPGEKLPSKRAFAQNLGVSVISVENAYAQLLAEGYLYAREKRGYYVDTIDTGLLWQAKPQISATAAVPEHAYFCDLKNNSLNAGFFPFSTWSKLMREILTEQYTKLLEPVPFNGIRELREQISSHLFHTRGMDVQPSQIIIGSGTENLYGALMQLFGRRKAVAVENPSYPKITKVYEKNGVKTVPVPVDEYGLCACALFASGAELAHISPSHQFPLGIVMPVRRRQELLKWAYQKPGRYILEDDYDSEFRFTGRPIPALQTMDTQARVVYINTFTKTLAPSIRISYMVLPTELAAVYQKELGFYSCTVPSFEQ